MAGMEESADMILGSEFLTWLWYESDIEPESFTAPDGSLFSVFMEQKIVVQGGNGKNVETASVSGALSPLREARFGIGNGKKVTRALLRLEKEDMFFQLTLSARDFCVSGLKTPKIEKRDDDEPDAILLEKLFLMESCMKLVDSLFARFLQFRLSPEWPKTVVAIANWSNRLD